MEKLFQWIIGGALSPIIKGALDGYKLKLDATNTHEQKATDIALKHMELDMREAEINNQAKMQIRGRWYEPENLFAYFIAFPYWFVAITMDFILLPAMGIDHVTFPLKGETATAMAMIMTFWFGKRAITSIGGVIAQVFAKR
jgi:hypothetical protein